MIRSCLRTFEAEQIGGLNVAYCNEKRSYCARNRGKTLNICGPLRAAQKIASAIHRKKKQENISLPSSFKKRHETAVESCFATMHV